MLKVSFMTVKLNLTIDEKVVARTKKYAARKKTTVSKMVQELLSRQLATEEKKPKKKGFAEKWAGTFSGQLSDKGVKEIKEEYLSKKYGY